MLKLYAENESEYNNGFPYEVSLISDKMRDILIDLRDLFRTSLTRYSSAKPFFSKSDSGDSMIDGFKLLCVRFKGLKYLTEKSQSIIFDEEFFGFRLYNVHFEGNSQQQCIAAAVLSHVAFNITHPPKLEAPFEVLEFLLGIRRRTTVTVVRTFISELPTIFSKYLRR